ncbi:MAG: FAD-binding oxidoreductase [Acidobacteriia bacterium]|nr:FAD-binding oxidoreductase [Terriglobia bacterium]
MNTAVETMQREFVAIVGASHVVSEPAACSALSVDGKAPQCVVYPASAADVTAVLRCAAELGLAVIPCRNGTKLGTGNPPRRYDVALSLKDMNRVWHYEPDDLTVTVEPGMKFGDFQHFVGRQGLWLPLDPPGGARASLGGIVATNATGPLRLYYGAPRDMVLGMKIATVEGKVVKAGGRVVKNVAGYDIAKLLIGSYGTLGVIVETSFKLFPLPAGRETFVMPTGTLSIARDLRRRILHSPLTPLRMVLLNPSAAELTLAGTPLERPVKEPEIWLEMAGSPRVLERCHGELEGLAKAAGAPLQRLASADAENVWTGISDLQSWLPGRSPGVVILRALLPDAASEELLSRAEQEAENDKALLAGFAQLGVGVLHFCLLSEAATPAVLGLIRRLRGAAESLGGVLIVERCHWDIKDRVDAWGSPGDDFAVMKKVKETWDPKGTLSPGRFLGRA